MGLDEDLGKVPTIAHLAAFAAKRFGSKLAIEDSQERLSFIALEKAATRVAAALIANHTEPGDRIAIWAPNSARWVVAALGAQMAGGVLVPLNTRLKGKEAGFILARSGASVLLTVTDFLDIDYPTLLRSEALPRLRQTVLMSGAGACSGWESFMESGRFVSEEDVLRRLNSVVETDCSDVIFTSGTTGMPKGVMTSHGQNLAMYRIYSRVLGLTSEDRFLMVNPFFNSFGYKAGWLSALMRGTAMLPQDIFDPLRVLERIERDRVSVLPGPPTLYQSLLVEPRLEDFDLHSLRVAITGAASIPAILIGQMRSKLGFEIVLTAYGLTETCGLVSMCCAADDIETIATTSGKAVEGVQIRVVDQLNRELPAGTPGEILVKGDNVMQGYYDDTDETSRTIDADGWLRTGDIGMLDATGYVRITDRKKDMFIVGGFNCYPAEIENMLLMHPAVARVAVIGVPDERLGEVAKAFVVLKAQASVTSAELVSWSRNNMANYKVPRSVEFVDGLPMNASGKVQRFSLRGLGSPNEPRKDA